MSIIEFAEKEMSLKLTCFQKDLLELISKTDFSINLIKPKTQDMRLVVDVYKKWYLSEREQLAKIS